MGVKIRDIAAIINGKVEGNSELEIFKPAKIEEAEGGDITFLYNSKYENHLYSTKASVVLISNAFEIDQSKFEDIPPALIRVEDVYQSLAVLMNYFGRGEQKVPVISELAFISKIAKLGEQIDVGAFAVISDGVEIGDDSIIGAQVYLGENVTIGKNVVLYPGVKIYSGCKIGDHCILHSNCVIGSDGFGFAPDENGVYQKIPQLGIVRIENDVEVGANVTIDRASLGETVVKSGVKLDNLVHIAHNSIIGENTVIAAQTGVAGSAKIGQNCQIGGQVGVAGHIAIGDRNRIQAQSGIGKNTKPDTAWFGTPAIDYRQYQKSFILFKNLEKLENRIKELEKKLESQ